MFLWCCSNLYKTESHKWNKRIYKSLKRVSWSICLMSLSFSLVGLTSRKDSSDVRWIFGHTWENKCINAFPEKNFYLNFRSHGREFVRELDNYKSDVFKKNNIYIVRIFAFLSEKSEFLEFLNFRVLTIFRVQMWVSVW